MSYLITAFKNVIFKNSTNIDAWYTWHIKACLITTYLSLKLLNVVVDYTLETC